MATTSAGVSKAGKRRPASAGTPAAPAKKARTPSAKAASTTPQAAKATPCRPAPAAQPQGSLLLSLPQTSEVRPLEPESDKAAARRARAELEQLIDEIEVRARSLKQVGLPGANGHVFAAAVTSYFPVTLCHCRPLTRHSTFWFLILFVWALLLLLSLFFIFSLDSFPFLTFIMSIPFGFLFLISICIFVHWVRLIMVYPWVSGDAQE